VASYAEVLGRISRGEYDDATPEVRADAVRTLIGLCSGAAAAVAFQPVPLLDAVLISPIQIGMVQGIGRIYGHRLDQKSILEILSTFGASLVAQNVLMAAAKLVPFLGWLASMSMAYALTWAIGEVSDHYFANGRGVSQDELRRMFKQSYREKKAEKERAHKGNETLKERLEQLRAAHQAGLIDDDEFARKKDEILSSF
jgi:uncharacterized protein (DUF697 family)